VVPRPYSHRKIPARMYIRSGQKGRSRMLMPNRSRTGAGSRLQRPTPMHGRVTPGVFAGEGRRAAPGRGACWVPVTSLQRRRHGHVVQIPTAKEEDAED
jgi:hypothetical protein